MPGEVGGSGSGMPAGGGAMLRAGRESLGLCRIVAWDQLQVVTTLLCRCRAIFTCKLCCLYAQGLCWPLQSVCRAL